MSEPVYLTPTGMTLRDYFAIHAPSDLIPAINIRADREELAGRIQPQNYPNGMDSVAFNADVEAALRYRFADAMLQERAK